MTASNTRWRQAYSRERAAVYDKFIQIGAGPLYQSFLQSAVEALTVLKGAGPLRVLDLGAGTGNVAGKILQELPQSRITCLDGSGDMLKVARRRFGADPRLRFLERDFSLPRWHRGLRDFDAVVSVGAIHHLNGPEKRNLFRQIRGLLGKRGVFICADPIQGSTRRAHQIYETAWVRQIQRNFLAIERKKIPLPRIREEHRRIQRAEGDQPSTLERQLGWMRQAGFQEVDCFWKYFGFAVFGGVNSN